MELGLLPPVGQGGVALGGVVDGQGIQTQGVEGGCVIDLPGDTCRVGQLGGLLGGDVLTQIHEDGVDRVGEGRVEIDVSVAHLTCVGNGLANAGEGPGGVAVEDGVEADPCLDGAQKGIGLHGRAHLEGGLIHIVELFDQVVVARIEGDDGPVTRVDREATGLQGRRKVLISGGGTGHLEHQILLVLFNGRDDLVPARVQVVRGEGGLLPLRQLITDHSQQVPVRTLVDVPGGVVDGLGH